MKKFINIRDGRLHATNYRFPDCLTTTFGDLITDAVAGMDNYLTADFDADELCKHPDAYYFITQYGVRCGSRRKGTEPLFEFADVDFAILTNNTVGIA